jgi:hypothetical protein
MRQLMPHPTTQRTRAQVSRFFDGLVLLAPGVVLVPAWRPDTDFEARTPAALWGGVARKAFPDER